MPNTLGVEFLCGWIGGASGVLFSHPLDTARVRIQTARPTERIRLSSVLQACVKSEGIAGLYKGLASPLVWIGMWKATIFTGYTATLKAVFPGQKQVSLSAHAGSAAVGAVAGAVVATPMEMVKCNAQVDRQAAAGLQQELRTLRTIVASGGAGNLFRGVGWMGAAGLLSMPVWFVTNEFVMQKRADACGGREKVPFVEKLICGAVCGSISWVPAYPFDKLKTLWQTHGGDRPLAFLLGKVRQEGLGFFYKGVGATLIRGLPQCGMTMAMYDVANSQFR